MGNTERSAHIKILRERMGITQKQLADMLEMSLTQVHDLENGKANVRKIHIMAIERASLSIALDKGKPEIADAGIRQDMIRFIKLWAGDA